MGRVIRRASFVVLAAAMLTVAGDSAHAGCLPWKEAGPLIAKNSLIPGNVIYQMVQKRTGGKIISATLCDNNGHFVYKLVVLGAKGDVTNVTVDAVTGQP